VTDRDTALRDGTLEAQTDDDTKTIVQINRKVLFAAAADTEKLSNSSALGHVLGGSEAECSEFSGAGLPRSSVLMTWAGLAQNTFGRRTL
jgi:hypothetical protein